MQSCLVGVFDANDAIPGGAGAHALVSMYDIINVVGANIIIDVPDSGPRLNSCIDLLQHHSKPGEHSAKHNLGKSAPVAQRQNPPCTRQPQLIHEHDTPQLMHALVSQPALSTGLPARQ